MEADRATRNWQKACWLAAITAASLLAGVLVGGEAGLLAAAAVFSALAGVVGSVRFGAAIFQAIFTDSPSRQPRGIERWLPLKGRWLRLFLGAPGAVLLCGALWTALFTCVFLALCLCYLFAHFCLQPFLGL